MISGFPNQIFAVYRDRFRKVETVTLEKEE